MRPVLRKGLRVVGWGVLGVLVLAVLAVGAALVWLGSEGGRERVTGLVNGLGLGVELTGLAGNLPFAPRIDRITVADAEGVWLVVEDAALDLEPGALLAGRVVVETLSAARIAVLRAPVGEEPAPQDTGGTLPTELPVAVRVESLSVARIELDASLAGEAAVLTLTGSADLPRKATGGRARLDVTRIEGRPARLSLDIAGGVSPQSLAVDILAEEPEGGLVAGMAGLDPATPFGFALKGSGPIADWHGRMDLGLGEFAVLGTDLDLTAGEAIALVLDGTLRGTVLDLPGAADAVGEEVAFRVGASLDQAMTVLGLEDTHIALAGARADLSGSVVLEGTLADLRLSASVPDLARLSGLAGLPLAGQAAVTARITGLASAPVVAANADVRGLRADTIGADTVTLRLDMDAARAFRLDGGATGLRLSAEALPLLGAAPTLRAEGALEDGGVRLGSLRLEGASVSVEGSAALTDAYNRVQAALRVSASRLAGLPALRGGALDLTVDAAGTLSPQDLSVQLAAKASDLALVEAALDRLVGPAPSLDLDLRLADGGVLVRTLDLKAARIGANGGMTLVSGGGLSGGFDLRVRDLAAVGEAAGLPVAGGVEGRIDVAGTIEAPDVKASLAGRDLIWQGQRLEGLDLAAEARNVLAAPAGSVRLRLAAPVDLAVETGFAVSETAIALDGLRIAMPTGAITGSARLVQASGLVEANLAGALSSLAPLSALIGPIDGALALDLRAATAGTRQTLAGQVRLENFAFGSGAEAIRVAGATLDLDITDAAAPRGTARLAATGLDPGAMELASLEADVTLDPVASRFAVAARGAGKPDIALDLAGTARAIDDGQVVTLTGLDGRVADETFALSRPATLTLSGGAVRLAGFDLGVQGGSVRADLGLGDTLSGRIAITDFPLRLLELVAPRAQPSGTLDGQVDFAGTLAAPSINARLATRAFRFAGLADVDVVASEVPGLDLDLEATVRPDRANASGRAVVGAGTRLAFRAALPLMQGDGMPVPARNAPLTAALEGTVDLGGLGALLPLGDDKLTGRLALDAAVTGSMASPVIAASVAMDGGRYENAAFGTVLRDMVLRLNGNGRRLVLERFTAADGAGGSIGASGVVTLAPGAAPSFDITTQMRSFRVARVDLLTAIASADLKLAGTSARSLLEGTITVERGDVQIPTVMPVSITEVAVTEINPPPGRRVAPPPPPPAEGPSMADTLRLGITIDIPGRFFVRGRGLDSEWGGSLAISGRASRPRVEGAISVRRGEYDFAGKVFKLSTGRIFFPPTRTISPEIDLVATTNAEGVTANIGLKGPVADPKLTLSSDPSLPSDEILSRVLFGKQVGALSGGEALQLAQAALALSGQGGGGVLNDVRTGLGLDRLQIDPSATDLGSSSVTAGKYLADNVFVGVQQGLGRESSKVTVEVEVFDNITVESRIGAASESDLGVNYKYDY